MTPGAVPFSPVTGSSRAAEALSNLFSGDGLFGDDRDYDRAYDQGYNDGREDEDRQDDGGQYDDGGGYDDGGFDGGFDGGSW